MGELHRSGFLQRTRGEPADPIVVDTERSSDGSMLPYPLLYRLPCLLNSLFYRHMC